MISCILSHTVSAQQLAGRYIAWVLKFPARHQAPALEGIHSSFGRKQDHKQWNDLSQGCTDKEAGIPIQGPRSLPHLPPSQPPHAQACLSFPRFREMTALPRVLRLWEVVIGRKSVHSPLLSPDRRLIFSLSRSICFQVSSKPRPGGAAQAARRRSG